jgi:hypothetical protein
MFVLFWSYIMSSACLKYGIISCFLRIGYVCLCSMCYIYVSSNTDDVGAPMANISLFIVFLVKLEVVLFHHHLQYMYNAKRREEFFLKQTC